MEISLQEFQKPPAACVKLIEQTLSLGRTGLGVGSLGRGGGVCVRTAPGGHDRRYATISAFEIDGATKSGWGRIGMQEPRPPAKTRLSQPCAFVLMHCNVVS